MIRQSFKRYWREHRTRPALRGHSRRRRRATVLGWWQADKRPKRELISGIVDMSAASA